MPRLRYIVPAFIFAVLGAGLVYALMAMQSGEKNPQTVPSALIGKPAPDFALAALPGYPGGLAAADLTGGVTVVNFFASWCPPCLAEHPQFMALAKDTSIRLFGVNYKDKEPNAVAWLGQHGNPYAKIGVDRLGRVAIDWGVYGVPETYVLDRDGVIRYRMAGPVTAEILRREILPLIEKLKK